MTVFLLVLLIFAVSLLMIGIRGVFYKKDNLMDLKEKERSLLSKDEIIDPDVDRMMNLLKNEAEDKTKNRKSNK